MTLVDTALILQSAAITVVFVRGSIFKRLRDAGPALWRELANCALCAGFWVGAGWRLFDAWQLHGWAFRVENVTVSSFAIGVLTAVAALGIVRVLDALEAYAEAQFELARARQAITDPPKPRETLRDTPKVPEWEAAHVARASFPSESPTDPTELTLERRQTAKIKLPGGDG